MPREKSDLARPMLSTTHYETYHPTAICAANWCCFIIATVLELGKQEESFRNYGLTQSTHQKVRGIQNKVQFLG